MKNDLEPLNKDMADEYVLRTVDFILNKKKNPMPANLMCIDLLTDPSAYPIYYRASNILESLVSTGFIEKQGSDGNATYNLTALGRQIIDSPTSPDLMKYRLFDRR